MLAHDSAPTHWPPKGLATHDDRRHPRLLVRRVRHRRRLARQREPRPRRLRGRAWDRQLAVRARSRRRLGALHRGLAPPLQPGDGGGPQRPTAVDDPRRAPPREPRAPARGVRRRRLHRCRHRPHEPRLAPPRPLARRGTRPHAPQGAVRDRAVLEREHRAHRRHGEARGPPVGCRARRRARARVQAATRGLLGVVPRCSTSRRRKC